MRSIVIRRRQGADHFRVGAPLALARPIRSSRALPEFLGRSQDCSLSSAEHARPESVADVSAPLPMDMIGTSPSATLKDACMVDARLGDDRRPSGSQSSRAPLNSLKDRRGVRVNRSAKG